MISSSNVLFIVVVAIMLMDRGGNKIVSEAKKQPTRVVVRQMVPSQQVTRNDPARATIVLHHQVPVPLWEFSYKSLGKPTRFSTIGGVSLYRPPPSSGTVRTNGEGDLLLFPGMTTRVREFGHKECSHMVHAVERHSGKSRYSLDILQFARPDLDPDPEDSFDRKNKQRSKSARRSPVSTYHDCSHPYHYGQFLDAVMQSTPGLGSAQSTVAGLTAEASIIRPGARSNGLSFTPRLAQRHHHQYSSLDHTAVVQEDLGFVMSPLVARLGIQPDDDDEALELLDAGGQGTRFTGGDPAFDAFDSLETEPRVVTIDRRDQLLTDKGIIEVSVVNLTTGEPVIKGGRGGLLPRLDIQIILDTFSSADIILPHTVGKTIKSNGSAGEKSDLSALSPKENVELAFLRLQVAGTPDRVLFPSHELHLHMTDYIHAQPLNSSTNQDRLAATQVQQVKAEVTIEDRHKIAQQEKLHIKKKEEKLPPRQRFLRPLPAHILLDTANAILVPHAVPFWTSTTVGVFPTDYGLPEHQDFTDSPKDHMLVVPAGQPYTILAIRVPDAGAALARAEAAKSVKKDKNDDDNDDSQLLTHSGEGMGDVLWMYRNVRMISSPLFHVPSPSRHRTHILNAVPLVDEGNGMEDELQQMEYDVRPWPYVVAVFSNDQQRQVIAIRLRDGEPLWNVTFLGKQWHSELSYGCAGVSRVEQGVITRRSEKHPWLNTTARVTSLRRSVYIGFYDPTTGVDGSVVHRHHTPPLSDAGTKTATWSIAETEWWAAVHFMGSGRSSATHLWPKVQPAGLRTIIKIEPTYPHSALTEDDDRGIGATQKWVWQHPGHGQVYPAANSSTCHVNIEDKGKNSTTPAFGVIYATLMEEDGTVPTLCAISDLDGHELWCIPVLGGQLTSHSSSPVEKQKSESPPLHCSVPNECSVGYPVILGDRVLVQVLREKSQDVLVQAFQIRGQHLVEAVKEQRSDVR